MKFTIPDDLKTQLHQVAASEESSAAQIIRRALREYFKQKEQS